MSKHLSHEDRIKIEAMLNDNKTVLEIANALGRDVSGIRREIINNRTETMPTKFNGANMNRCVHRSSCTRYRICSHKCTKPCRLCSLCNQSCAAFELLLCSRLKKGGFACNGCFAHCYNTRTKLYYKATDAQKKYRSKLVENREGINCSKEELKRISDIVSPLIAQGQSIKQIFMTHKDELGISEKTLYNYIDARIIDGTMNLDLPRKVKFKLRKTYVPKQINRLCRLDRTYEDYKKYTTDTAYSIVEMDCVEGKKGEPLLLTLLIRNAHLLLAFKIETQTTAEVVAIFNQLELVLGAEKFKSLFQVILTDNGAEFSDPEALEFNPCTGERRTKIFYCDPCASQQKARIEQAHTFIRRFVPKGCSFLKYEQNQINTMLSHINSTPREHLNKKSPYELFCLLYGEKTAKAIGINGIDRDAVTLKRTVLSR